MARRKEVIEALGQNGSLGEGRFRSAAKTFEAKARRSGSVETRYDVTRTKQTLLGSIFGLAPKVVKETVGNASEIRGERYRDADIKASAINTNTGEVVGQGGVSRNSRNRATFEVERKAMWHERLFDMFASKAKVPSKPATPPAMANESREPQPFEVKDEPVFEMPKEPKEAQAFGFTAEAPSDIHEGATSYSDYSAELDGIMRGDFAQASTDETEIDLAAPAAANDRVLTWDYTAAVNGFDRPDSTETADTALESEPDVYMLGRSAKATAAPAPQAA